MTAPTRTVRRRPHPLLTLAGWVVIGLVLGVVFWCVGFCLAWVSDVFAGFKP